MNLDAILVVPVTTLYSLAIVSLLMWLAGSRFSTVRQIIVAYAAFGVAAIGADAAKYANGATSHYAGFALAILGIALAAAIHAAYLKTTRKPA